MLKFKFNSLFNLFLLAVLFSFFSCNKNEMEPETVSLPVIETFNPVTKEILSSEISDLALYKEQVFVVNSMSELPDDEIFDNEEFLNQDIDFSKYSLIIFYNLQFGKILSTEYKWGYNNYFDQYVVRIIYEIEKGSTYVDGEIELTTYVRGAMLVDHIPPQPFVSQWIGTYFIEPK